MLAGCATVDRKPAVPLTGDIMIDGPNAIENGPERDRVLWQYRTAAAAMRRGEIELAKRYLDDALLTLGGIYDPNESARKARSLFAPNQRRPLSASRTSAPWRIFIAAFCTGWTVSRTTPARVFGARCSRMPAQRKNGMRPTTRCSSISKG